METQKGDFSIGDIKFHYFKIEFENAIQVFIYGNKEKLGSLAVGTPIPEDKKATASTMLGDRKRPSAVISEALAERFAAKTNKISLISCHLDEDVPIIDFLKTTLDAITI